MVNIIKFIKHPELLLNFGIGKIVETYNMTIHNSYSQRQEDILIDTFLKNKNHGFYVDVGANDPIKLNNTYRFYKRGWTGINIEPHKLRFKKLSKVRPNDININIGISKKPGILKYYEMHPDVVSTFSKEEMERLKKDNIQVVNVLPIRVERLSFILDKYNPKEIDLLSVDTEGFDLDVLESNNWKKYSPKLICVEIDKDKPLAIKKFMKTKGYEEVFNNKLNSFFMKKKEYI